MEHIDYHVGLLRGFILAHNAPTIILHALDVMLNGYRAKGGHTIGSADRERLNPIPVNEDERMDIKVEKPKPVIIEKKPTAPQDDGETSRVFVRWQPDELTKLKELAAKGKTCAEITKLLGGGRKYSGVYAKMASLNLV